MKKNDPSQISCIHRDALQGTVDGRCCAGRFVDDVEWIAFFCEGESCRENEYA